MTGLEVFQAMQKHASGRHAKGSMMISGADVKALVEWLSPTSLRPVGALEKAMIQEPDSRGSDE